MIKKYIITLCLLTATFSAIADEFTVPGTNVSFSVPNGWQCIDGKGFSKIMRNLKDKEEFKKTISILEQVNKYAFVKKLNNEGKLVNSNFIVVTMKLGGETLNLEKIINSHIKDKNALPGVLKISKGVCPEIKSTNYRCLSQHSKRKNRSTRQYHYVIINNDMFIQFSFNAATSKEIREIEGIIKNISFKKI